MPTGLARILVPLDDSERAERAIPVAARIARGQGRALVFVHAVIPAVLCGPPLSPACLGAQQTSGCA